MSGFLYGRAGSRPHTRDIRIRTEPKGAAIVRRGIQAVRCYKVRYRGEIEEIHHILSDFAAPRHISLAVPRRTTIWVEALDTGGIIDLRVRHREGRGFEFTDVQHLGPPIYDGRALMSATPAVRGVLERLVCETLRSANTGTSWFGDLILT